ncbi:MAG: triose-phosphate isomerase [Deinococcales bacterium]
MKPLLSLNWKLQKGPAESYAWCRALLEQLPEELPADLAIMAPTISLERVSNALRGSPVQWGAQDVSKHQKGAYTGETAPQWLNELDCSYVIIGHSERRDYHGETDIIAGEKTAVAIRAGIKPILCVGEKLDVREAGNAESHTLRQLETALAWLTPEVLADEFRGVLEWLTIAYEPIWAIGTGRTATPEDAENMGNAMRSWFVERYGQAGNNLRLLYGGSVKPDNIKALCSRQNVNGALVGGASLELESVLEMLEALEG